MLKLPAKFTSCLPRKVQDFLNDKRGVFAIDLAFAAPILAGLMLGGVEVTRFVMLNQKIERTSVTMADLVSQSETLTEGDLSGLFLATSGVMTPFDMDANGKVIVSSVSTPAGGSPTINWQRSFGSQTSGSAVGAEGGAASLPAGFELREFESVIVAEVYYNFDPMIVNGVMDNHILYNRAIFRPRFGSLTTIN